MATAPWVGHTIPSFHRFVWNLRWPNGIRRRLNAGTRHVKATDYVGQASRRYRLSSTKSNPKAILSINLICAPDLNSSYVYQVPSAVGRVLRTHSLFLLAHCQNFRFLNSLFLANMVWLYFPPDHCRRGRLDWFCYNVHSSSVPDYADTTRS